MDTIDYRFVAKGASITHAGVVEQTKNHARLAERYSVQLAKRGWLQIHTDMLHEVVKLIDNERSRVLDARYESKANLLREEAAITTAKSFKADLVMAFDDLYFERHIDAAAHKRVRTTNGPLGRSSTLIVKYLADVRSAVEMHEGQLRPYFEGESALTLLDDVKAELDDAQTTQELDYKSLPRETLKVYEAKGRALFLIEKMNRIGKRVFAGQAEMVALFNKDLILRARKARRSASGIEPVEGAVDTGCGEETA